MRLRPVRLPRARSDACPDISARGPASGGDAARRAFAVAGRAGPAITARTPEATNSTFDERKGKAFPQRQFTFIAKRSACCAARSALSLHLHIAQSPHRACCRGARVSPCAVPRPPEPQTCRDRRCRRSVRPPHTDCVARHKTCQHGKIVFPFCINALYRLRHTTPKREMGVDWHDLAVKLPLICPKKSARNLGHSPACVGVLRRSSPRCAVLRFGSLCSTSHAHAEVEEQTREAV